MPQRIKSNPLTERKLIRHEGEAVNVVYALSGPVERALYEGRLGGIHAFAHQYTDLITLKPEEGIVSVRSDGELSFSREAIAIHKVLHFHYDSGHVLYVRTKESLIREELWTEGIGRRGKKLFVFFPPTSEKPDKHHPIGRKSRRHKGRSGRN